MSSPFTGKQDKHDTNANATCTRRGYLQLTTASAAVAVGAGSVTAGESNGETDGYGDGAYGELEFGGTMTDEDMSDDEEGSEGEESNGSGGQPGNGRGRPNWSNR